MNRRSGLQQQPCRRSAAQLPTAEVGAAVSTRLHRPQRRCDASTFWRNRWESGAQLSKLLLFFLAVGKLFASICCFGGAGCAAATQTKAQVRRRKKKKKQQRAQCETRPWTPWRPRSLSWRQMLWQQQNVWAEMCAVKQQIRQTFPPSCVATKVSDGTKELPTLSALMLRCTYREWAQHRVCTTTSGFDAGKMMSLPLPRVWMDENIYQTNFRFIFSWIQISSSRPVISTWSPKEKLVVSSEPKLKETRYHVLTKTAFAEKISFCNLLTHKKKYRALKCKCCLFKVTKIHHCNICICRKLCLDSHPCIEPQQELKTRSSEVKHSILGRCSST